MNTRTCKHCGAEKELTEFYKNKFGPDGLHSWCKPCVKARAAKTNRDNNYKNQAAYHNRTKPYMYLLEDQETNEFYIGSSVKKWCKRSANHHFLKGRSKTKVKLTQFFCASEVEAREKEAEWIDLHIEDPLCFNKQRVNNIKLARG